MDQDDTERAIEARASEDGAFAVAYALLKIGKALNVRPLTVDELDEPIDKVFILSNRTINKLAEHGIRTVRDLTQKSRSEIFMLEGVGTETIREILSGPTTSRPSTMNLTLPYIATNGMIFYDTTLSAPVVHDGANWRTFAGVIA